MKILPLLFVLLLVGCGPAKKLQTMPEPLSLEELVYQYNENFYKIPPLRATVGQWTLEFLEEYIDADGQLQRKYHRYNELGGRLFFQPGIGTANRGSFYLLTRAPANPEALVIASNEQQYWMYTRSGGFGYWGNYEDFQAGRDEVFFDPQLLLDFIGWRPLNFYPVPPAYKVLPEHNILFYVEYENNRGRIAKELIFDRRSNRLIEVRGYDYDGQLIMHSQLENYIEMEQANAWLPTKITISFPQQESSMTLRLEKFMVDQADRSRVFQRPESIEGVEQFLQIGR